MVKLLAPATGAAVVLFAPADATAGGAVVEDAGGIAVEGLEGVIAIGAEGVIVDGADGVAAIGGAGGATVDCARTDPAPRAPNIIAAENILFIVSLQFREGGYIQYVGTW